MPMAAPDHEALPGSAGLLRQPHLLPDPGQLPYYEGILPNAGAVPLLPG